MTLAVVTGTAPLTVRLKGATTDTPVDLVRQGSTGWVLRERVEVEIVDRLVVASRLVTP